MESFDVLINNCGEIHDIPCESLNSNTWFTDNIKLVAIFDPSEKYRLIETYGMYCYIETPEGLRLEVGFTNRDFLISWLLGFGSKVKVVEPISIAEDIKIIAKKILSRYD